MHLCLNLKIQYLPLFPPPPFCESSVPIDPSAGADILAPAVAGRLDILVLDIVDDIF